MNTHTTPSSTPLIGIDERSEAFVDDIMECIVDPAMDSLLRMSGQKMVAISPKMQQPPPNIKNHLREIMEEARSFNESEEASRSEKELSFYALDVENIEELVRT